MTNVSAVDNVPLFAARTSFVAHLAAPLVDTPTEIVPATDTAAPTFEVDAAALRAALEESIVSAFVDAARAADAPLDEAAFLALLGDADGGEADDSHGLLVLSGADEDDDGLVVAAAAELDDASTESAGLLVAE